MHQTLLTTHSIFRWMVLLSLLYSIYTAYSGYRNKKHFSKSDDQIRHWTATISHIQLILGITLYFKSPVVKYAISNTLSSTLFTEHTFFKYIHIALMILSVVLITIGSSIAKRKTLDKDKFQTMLIWFSIALAVIFIAIPWPFSPLVNRPYIRSF